MRIIAGKFKGRVIPAASKGEVRPTSDRVKESLFSTLSSLGGIEGLHVLDLFAGTGGLGLESLSRGAETCVFVEQNRTVAERLKEFVQKLEVQHCVTVEQVSVKKYLGDSNRQSETKFDLVFLDPPYGKCSSAELLLLLCKSGLLRSTSRIVFEASEAIDLGSVQRSLEEAGSYLSLELEKAKSFGDTVVTYFVTHPRQVHE